MDDPTDALERENASLRRALQLLHRIANLLRESLEEEAACYAVLTGVTAGVGLGFNRAMLFLEDGRGQLRGAMAVGPATKEEADRVWRSIAEEHVDLETLYEAGLRAREERNSELDQRVRGLRISVQSDTPIGIALRRGRMVHRVGGDDLEGLLHLPTGVAAPLRSSRGIAGVLYADNSFTGARCEPALELAFALIADHAGRVVDNTRRFERVAVAARTDTLTGLEHHGALMAAVDQAVGGGGPLSYLMIDLDDFKKVNDLHGHLAGDALLVALAARLKRRIRPTARAYRYGGEEFAVLLQDVDQDEAAIVGERICEAVANESFFLGSEEVHVTCSIGVATLTPGQTGRDLVAAADAALYAAKRAGKNRVVRSSAA